MSSVIQSGSDTGANHLDDAEVRLTNVKAGNLLIAVSASNDFQNTSGGIVMDGDSISAKNMGFVEGDSVSLGGFPTDYGALVVYLAEVDYDDDYDIYVNYGHGGATQLIVAEVEGIKYSINATGEDSSTSATSISMTTGTPSSADQLAIMAAVFFDDDFTSFSYSGDFSGNEEQFIQANVSNNDMSLGVAIVEMIGQSAAISESVTTSGGGSEQCIGIINSFPNEPEGLLPAIYHQRHHNRAL